MLDSGRARVFNVSPQRSGTKAFHALCRANGLRSAHYPGAELDDRAGVAVPDLDARRLWLLYRDDYYRSADIFSDFPTPLIYREAFMAFPEAKFVMITRDPAAWVRSVRKITADRDLSWLERFFYHQVIRPSFGGRGLEPYSDRELALGYTTFCSNAVRYLRLFSAKIFVGVLEDIHLDERLADFLGFELTARLEHVD